MTSSTPSVAEARPATIPEGLKVDCDAAVALPDRALTTADISLWGKDRAALGDCRRRHRALADAATQLEKQGQ